MVEDDFSLLLAEGRIRTSESDSDSKQEPDPKPNPAPKSNPDPKPDPDRKPDPAPKSDPAPEPDTAPKPDPNPKPDLYEKFLDEQRLDKRDCRKELSWTPQSRILIQKRIKMKIDSQSSDGSASRKPPGLAD
jgi:hypothetical protein